MLFVSVCVCVYVWLCRVKLWWCSIKQPVRNQKLSSSKFGKRRIKFLNLKTWVISRSIEFKITSKFEVKNIWTYLTALPCASLFDDWWWDIMGCMMDSCLKVMVIYISPLKHCLLSGSSMIPPVADDIRGDSASRSVSPVKH